MNITLIVLIALLLGIWGLAFYMDWLGLWVSKEQLHREVDAARVRMLELSRQSANTIP